MATGTPAATREALAVAYIGLGNWISLHTEDPSTNGQNELTGGSYARKQTTWTAGASDGQAVGSQVTFDVPASTVKWAGIWSAASGGTFIDKIAIPQTQVGAPAQVLVTPTVTVT